MWKDRLSEREIGGCRAVSGAGLRCKGSQNIEATDLSRDNLGREIGRR